MARTDTLGNFLTDVADAIREKKGTSETILASNFDTEIENLPSGGNKLGYVTSLQNFFSNGGMPSTLTNIDLTQNFDFVKKTGSDSFSLQGTFYGNSNLKDLTIKFGDLGNVNMNSTFYYLNNLETLIIQSDAVLNLKNMFRAFGLCPKLSFLDIRTLTVSTITGTSSYYSEAFDGTPSDCEIIVANDTEKSWLTTKFPSLTNVKTVEEYEAE